MAEDNAEALQWFRERLDQLAKVREVDIAEQAMFTAIREARERGLSQHAVVVELTQHGFTTRKDTALSLIQVQRTMRRAAIAWKWSWS